MHITSSVENIEIRTKNESQNIYEALLPLDNAVETPQAFEFQVEGEAGESFTLQLSRKEIPSFEENEKRLTMNVTPSSEDSATSANIRFTNVHFDKDTDVLTITAQLLAPQESIGVVVTLFTPIKVSDVTLFHRIPSNHSLNGNSSNNNASRQSSPESLGEPQLPASTNDAIVPTAAAPEQNTDHTEDAGRGLGMGRGGCCSIS